MVSGSKHYTRREFWVGLPLQLILAAKMPPAAADFYFRTFTFPAQMDGLLPS